MKKLLTLIAALVFIVMVVGCETIDPQPSIRKHRDPLPDSVKAPTPRK